jgi:DNA adenine methylase
VRPLLKWAGGKALLAPRIVEALGEPSEWSSYVEPFLGSGAVFFHLRSIGYRGPALLSDACPRLVAFHRAVRDHVDELLKVLRTLPTGDGWEGAYSELRDELNQGDPDGPRKAAVFLWINRACFNGLYRENRAGKFNVPVGRYAKVALPDEDHIRAASEALRGTVIECRDFAPSLLLALECDAAYLDPPYLPASPTASFVGYSASGFGLDEQRRLASHARSAVARVVVSNADVPLVSELYPDDAFEVDRFDVRRSISRGARGAAGEVLIRRRR